MAPAPIYCTHKELKRVYPQIDSFDAKTPIYGFTKELDDWGSASGLDLYYSWNTGLVNQLFVDGVLATKIELPTSADGTSTAGATIENAEAILVTSDPTSTFAAGDIIKFGTFYAKVSGATAGGTPNVAITDGSSNANTMFGTKSVQVAASTSIYLALDATATNAPTGSIFLYDSDLDLLVLTVDSNQNPNDLLIEAGEDFTTMITQFRTDASRFLDSKLDPNLPREQLKDKSGNFDYMIIRSTALIAAAFLIRASDPTNEVANALMEEAQGNIDALNSGGAALSWQTTRDASRGIIRDVSYTDGSVRPVDTRGTWNGTFDLIRVTIVGGGAIDGTATYSVWVKNSDKLGNQQGTQVVTAEKINGDYQALAGGLQIRFAGENKTSVATATNEWEIEVMGAAEHVDASGVKSVQNSRWL